MFFIVGDDFEVTPSREYAEAYKRDALALRVSGDFAVASPDPRAVRAQADGDPVVAVAGFTPAATDHWG